MKSIFNNIKLIFQILKKKQIYSFYLIILLTFISIFLDLIGIGFFLPIINVLFDQEVYLQKDYLNKYVNFLTNYSEINIYILLFIWLI